MIPDRRPESHCPAGLARTGCTRTRQVVVGLARGETYLFDGVRASLTRAAMRKGRRSGLPMQKKVLIRRFLRQPPYERHSAGTYLLFAAGVVHVQVIVPSAFTRGVYVRTTPFAAAVPVTATTPVASVQVLESTFLVALAVRRFVTPLQAPAAMTPPLLAIFSPIVAFMPEAAIASSVTRARTV